MRWEREEHVNEQYVKGFSYKHNFFCEELLTFKFVFLELDISSLFYSAFPAASHTDQTVIWPWYAHSYYISGVLGSRKNYIFVQKKAKKSHFSEGSAAAFRINPI